MMKKLMSLGLVGILSASLMVGCSSNDSKDDDTVTIKYVDEQGNVVKKEHVTKEEAKQIEQQQTTKKETAKEQPSKKETSKQHEDSTTNDDGNYDKELYGNALLDTCPDCGRSAMIFNNDQGLKCAYCGFYDAYYYLPEEPDPSYSDNKEDDYTPEDNSDDYDYDDSQDYEEPEIDNDVEESPSEAVEQEEILP